MKVLVCGGREYADKKTMAKVLDALNLNGSIEIVIHGDAPGADRLAGQWAESRNIHAAAVPALWKKFRNAAGPKRNRAMLLLEPTQVVAFPGGTGTADMIRAATAAGIPVLDVSKLAQPKPRAQEG